MAAEVLMPASGHLTTYLGTAPGVGKTFSMLAEASRRSAEGARVVVAWLEPHDRPDTLAQVSDLEMIAPASVSYRGRDFPEVDVEAVLATKPELAVVDELAHSWPDGGRKRWMDVSELLEAGVDVLTSLNVANMSSARDYVARVTGAGAVESVPDGFVRSGDVVLIDLPAQTLRNRLASGKVVSAEQVGGALGEYFRVSNLEALSQLGQAWMSGTVEQVGDTLLVQRGLDPFNPRLVVMAGVSESPWGEAVILRAAQLACDNDADLLVIHTQVSDGAAPRHLELLDYYRQLAEGLGGSYVEVAGDSPARVLAEEASARPVSTVVVARHRSILRELVRGSVARQLRRLRPELQLEEVHNRTPAAIPSPT
jgi:two-component system sensor histidine kinase KdpD